MNDLLHVAIVVLILGVVLCAVTIWLWGTGKVVSRRELDARLANAMRELSDVVAVRQNELYAMTADRDGWRNKSLDFERKLSRTVETNDLLLAELKQSRQVMPRQPEGDCSDGAGQ